MIQPLDLQNLLVNTLAGNMYIFIGIALIFIAILAAKFKMPSVIFGIVIVLFAAIMSAYAFWLWILVAIIGAFLIYYSIIRLFKG